MPSRIPVPRKVRSEAPTGIAAVAAAAWIYFHQCVARVRDSREAEEALLGITDEELSEPGRRG
jgi:hypothetical protein